MLILSEFQHKTAKETIFTKRSEVNVILYETLMLSELWRENDLFLEIRRNRHLNIEFFDHRPSYFFFEMLMLSELWP